LKENDRSTRNTKFQLLLKGKETKTKREKKENLTLRLVWA